LQKNTKSLTWKNIYLKHKRINHVHFVYNWYNNHKTDILRIFNLLFVDDMNHIDQICNEEVFIMDINYSMSNKGDELDGSEFER
jgi:hypothetical protein